MEQVVGPLAVGLLAVSVAIQLYLAVELTRARHALKRIAAKLAGPIHSHLPFSNDGVMGSPAGYAIYVYRRGRWEIEADLSAPGFEPSSPTMAGSYEGQMIKKESVPAR